MTVKTKFSWNFQPTATSTVWPFVAESLRKECGDLKEVNSDNHDEKDDDDANRKDVEVVEIGTPGESLTMLESLVNLKYRSKEERNSFGVIKDKLKKRRVLSKKQRHINDYFILEQSLYNRVYYLIFRFKILQNAAI